MSYTKEFHKNIHRKTDYASQLISGMVMELFPQIDSVVDVGCGLGTWLNAFSRNGVSTVLGLDGAWVDRTKLKIPASSFVESDLNAELRLDGRYDLAMCLEVAEHINETNAEHLIDFLSARSGVILFSAAIPGQGGTYHVNEQWLSYWVTKFKQRGFRPLDIIRPAIWDNDAIPYWYRQNIILLLDDAALHQRKSAAWEATDMPVDVVHPYLYQERVHLTTVKEAWMLLGGAVRRSLTQRLGRST